MVFCVRVWGTQSEKNVELWEWVRRRDARMVGGLERRSCEGRLRELGSCGLEERRVREELVVAFQYFKGSFRQEGDRHFTRGR